MATTEHIVAYFNCVKKSVKKLDLANIAYDKIELLHHYLYTLKESVGLEQALVNWHILSVLDKCGLRKSNT